MGEVKLVRDVTPAECPWLHRIYRKDERVFEYHGYTYGCISDTGEAFSEEDGKTPFFELPANSICNV